MNHAQADVGLGRDGVVVVMVVLVVLSGGLHAGQGGSQCMSPTDALCGGGKKSVRNHQDWQLGGVAAPGSNLAPAPMTVLGKPQVSWADERPRRTQDGWAGGLDPSGWRWRRQQRRRGKIGSKG